MTFFYFSLQRIGSRKLLCIQSVKLNADTLHSWIATNNADHSAGIFYKSSKRIKLDLHLMLLQASHFITKMNATITCILFYLFHWKMVAEPCPKCMRICTVFQQQTRTDTRGTQMFQKSRNHLKILGAKWLE
jgi:hypothetical protein